MVQRRRKPCRPWSPLACLKLHRHHHQSSRRRPLDTAVVVTTTIHPTNGQKRKKAALFWLSQRPPTAQRSGLGSGVRGRRPRPPPQQRLTLAALRLITAARWAELGGRRQPSRAQTHSCSLVASGLPGGGGVAGRCVILERRRLQKTRGDTGTLGDCSH